MAKTTKQNITLDYLTTRVMALEDELTKVKSAYQMVRDDAEMYHNLYTKLAHLVKLAMKDFKVKDEGSFTYLYWKDSFIALDTIGKVKDFADLLELIDLAQHIIEREE